MTGMPRTRLPYLQREKTRHGKMKWYFRRERGERIRLPDAYGTDAFMKAYHAALHGQAAPETPSRTQTGSLRWLIEQWMRSSDWLVETKPSTQRQRANILQHVVDKAGHQAYTSITAKSIMNGREARAATPHAANNFLKVMKALFSWAMQCGFVDNNPAQAVKFLNVKTRGHIPWTQEDVDRYCRRWPIGTRERLAFELIYAIGLRRSDVVRIGRQHVRDGVLTIETQKTGTPVYMVIDDHLQSVLDASPTGDMIFFVGKRGRPMTPESFGNWFRDACNAAGLSGKSAHGIRKTVSIEEVEAGATEDEVQSSKGWTTNKQSLVYTKEKNRKRLAIQAQTKRKRERSLPHLDAGAGKNRKN